MRELPIYRCPKCARDQIIQPVFGDKVVSAFHLHREGGLAGRSEPVRMQEVLEPAGALSRELVAVVTTHA
jgi:hypothetical protein